MRDYLDKFKLTVQQIYERFCQADILIDLPCTDEDVEKLIKFCQLALDCSLNISEIEAIIKVCDQDSVRMMPFIIGAQLKAENSNDQSAIEHEIIINQELFVNTLQHLKDIAKQII